MLVDFNKLLEADILKEVEERKSRERSGKFSPSRMGRCYRYQLWQRLQEVETDPIPLEVYRKFRAGNIYHADLQSLVPEKTVEVEFENENFKCFADHVGKDFVVDFKTVFSRSFAMMKKQSREEIIESKFNYVVQILAYCYFLNKPMGYLVFVNKDDYDIIQVEVKLEDYLSLIKDEIEILAGYYNNWIKKEKLPPCQPRCFINKRSGKSAEKKYCNYRSHELCESCK